MVVIELFIPFRGGASNGVFLLHDINWAVRYIVLGRTHISRTVRHFDLFIPVHCPEGLAPSLLLNTELSNVSSKKSRT